MSDYAVKSTPRIVDGKPILEYSLWNGDKLVRKLTDADMAGISRQVQEHMLEFWRMPAGQLCEWGKV